MNSTHPEGQEGIRNTQLGSHSVPTHLLITDGILVHRGTMIEKLGKACSGDTGPERRQKKD